MAHDLEKKWRSQDVQLPENVDFSAMLLSDRVLYGLKKAGFKKPSPIQLEAIPLSKVGKDLLVQAKSGTGKTLVFVITALEMLKRKLFRPQVLIVTPTREIATQICSVVTSIGCGFPKLTCHSFIGGLSLSDNFEIAKTCQIVVGTPGRINQLITEKAFPVNSIRLLVFDEADRLLQISYKDDINNIFNSLPEDKQVIVSSATYPEKLKKLLLKYLREPHMACLNSREIALLAIVHYAKIVKSSPMMLLQYKFKLSALEEILTAVKFSQCLVFVNGIQSAEVLHKDIKKWGFSVTYISSAKEQCDRLKAIDRLKRFKCKVLVSSDVTSRGIDAENVDLVISFDLARDTETYMHRAGRAGRYGSIGVTISLIEDKQLTYLRRMETQASFKTYKLPDPVPKELIQNRSFGEYIIKDQDSDSEQESLKKDDVETDILVDDKNNITEKCNTEDTEKHSSVQDTGPKENDCILTNETTTENILNAFETEGNCSFSNKENILQPISSDSDVEYLGCYLRCENDQVNIEDINCVCQSFELPVSIKEEAYLDNVPLEEKNNNIDIENASHSLIENAIDSLIENASHSLLKNDVEVFDEKLCESGNESVPQSFQQIDNSIKNHTQNASLSDMLESDIYVRSDLCTEDLKDVINTFLNEYGSDGSMESCDESENEELEVEEEAASKSITDCAIRNLNSKKDSYVCMVWKKYEEEKNKECNTPGENKSEENNEISTMSFQNETFKQDVPLETLNCEICSHLASNCVCNTTEKQDQMNIKKIELASLAESSCDAYSTSKDLKSVEIPQSQLDSQFKQMTEVHEKYSKDPVDNLKTEGLHESSKNLDNPVKILKFRYQKSPNKLKCESTPQLYAKSKDAFISSDQSTSEYSDDTEVEKHYKNLKHPIKKSKSRYQELPTKMKCESTPQLYAKSKSTFISSNQSTSEYSDDTGVEKEVDLDVSQCSSSSDSDEESSLDSSDSSSSDDSYHHNKFRTGKQNPSLVSSSDSHSQVRNNSKCKQNHHNGVSCSQPSHLRSHQPISCPHLKNSPHLPFFRHPVNKKCNAVPIHRKTAARNNCEKPVSSKRHLTACNRNCFQPSEHRCHCEHRYHSFCNQMQVCSNWYKTFYNQWKHIQICINSARM